MRYGHKVVAFEQSEDGVAATAEVRTPDGCTETQTFRGDILVAADGSQSFVRSKLVPGEQRRWGIEFINQLCSMRGSVDGHGMDCLAFSRGR